MKLPSLIFSLLLTFPVFAEDQADLEREKRMADEIVDTILDGEPVQLQAGDHDFLAIYTQAEDARGTVLILHGRGFHPDWQTVVQPLRIGLVEQGWSTLAIQLPVLNKEAKYLDYVKVFPEAIPRIEAAIDYVKAANPGERLVMLAHSCGTHMAQHWMLQRPESAQTRIDAFVGIGMGATDYGQDMVEPFALDRIQVPVLDVYADGDYPAVKKSAPQRWKMIMNAGNPKSAQKAVPQSEHYYSGRGEALTSVVAQWLDTL